MNFQFLSSPQGVFSAIALLGRSRSLTTPEFGATMNKSDIRGLATAGLTSVGGGLALQADVAPGLPSTVQGWVEGSPVVHSGVVGLLSSSWPHGLPALPAATAASGRCCHDH